MKKLLPVLLVSSISILLLVASIEVLMSKGVIRPTFTNHMGLGIYLDNDLVYRIAPRCREDINSDGYRDGEFEAPKTPGLKRVAFLGDSFIMGLYVGPGETLPSMLERVSNHKLEVYNMGVFGYGPDQSLNQMLIDVPRFMPDAIVLGIYPSNDFNDIIRNRLYAATRDGRIIRQKDNSATSTLPALKTLYLIDYLALKVGIIRPRMVKIMQAVTSTSNNDDAFVHRAGSDEASYKRALMSGILKEIKLKADEMGVELLAVVIPSIWNIQDRSFLRSTDWPEDKMLINEYIVGEMLAEAGIRHINFAEVFKSRQFEKPLYDPMLDNHLSVYGHLVVADEIWKALNASK